MLMQHTDQRLNVENLQFGTAGGGHGVSGVGKYLTSL